MIDKLILRVLALLCVLLPALPAAASVNVFATVPEWAALAKEIGGDKVNVLGPPPPFKTPTASRRVRR